MSELIQPCLLALTPPGVGAAALRLLVQELAGSSVRSLYCGHGSQTSWRLPRHAHLDVKHGTARRAAVQYTIRVSEDTVSLSGVLKRWVDARSGLWEQF